MTKVIDVRLAGAHPAVERAKAETPEQFRKDLDLLVQGAREQDKGAPGNEDGHKIAETNSGIAMFLYGYLQDFVNDPANKVNTETTKLINGDSDVDDDYDLD